MFFRPFSNDWSTYPPNLPYSGKPMVNEPGLLFLEVPIADSWNLDPKEHCIIFPSLQSFQHPKLLVSGIYVPIGSSFAIHLKCHSLWVNVVPEPLLSGDSLRSRRWQLPCLLPPGPQRPVTKTSTKGKMERLHFGHSDIDWFFFRPWNNLKPAKWWWYFSANWNFVELNHHFSMCAASAQKKKP